jgi:hypothetical protein
MNGVCALFYGPGAFSEPGLGGRESLLEELQVWGGNPSVIWNAGLQLYIMTWHSWEGANLHISSSPDLMHWAPTVQLVAVRAPSALRGFNPPWRPTPCARAHPHYQGSPVSSAATLPAGHDCLRHPVLEATELSVA